jgi:hypothetical protein
MDGPLHLHLELSEHETRILLDALRAFPADGRDQGCIAALAGKVARALRLFEFGDRS